MYCSPQALRHGYKSKQDHHRQNNRYQCGGQFANAKQPMYFVTCSFSSCGERSHKDRVHVTNCLRTTEAEDHPAHSVTIQLTLWQSSSTSLSHSALGEASVGVPIQRCFTSTETIKTIRDGEPRTSTSSFKQLLSSKTSGTPPFKVFDGPLLLLSEPVIDLALGR